MSAVRLLVLGAIRQLGTAHGYAVRRQLENWHVETWTTVRSGSIYHAIGQLHKEGKLEAHGSQTGERGSERLMFSITAAGEEEFFVLLDKALSRFELSELSTGIAFIGELPPAKAKRLLDDLHKRLCANRDHLAALAASTPHEGGAPRLYDLLGIWHAYLDTTASSVKRLGKRVMEKQ